MKRKNLMTPGPSPVPSFLREVLAKEIIHHRTDEFRNILADVHQGLQSLLFTKNPLVLLSVPFSLFFSSFCVRFTYFTHC